MSRSFDPNQRCFTNAGHIIGACSIELTIENKVLVFSGDVGRDNDALMYPPPKKSRLCVS
jgi:metallo-beta-lactamase family protein